MYICKMREDTFGNYAASKDLASILNELNDKKINKKVTNIMKLYFASINDLLETKKFTERFIRHYYKGFGIYVMQTNLPIEIKTRILNIAKARKNQAMEKVKACGDTITQ